MKRIISQTLLVVLYLATTISCTQDDGINIILQEDPNGIEFTNELSSKYLLSSAVASGIVERLVWKPVDFGAPIEATFRLEGSIDNENFTEISTTSQNNIAIKVSDLLALAENLGLDEDKSTTDPDGNPNNIGTVYLRVIGLSGGNNTPNTEMVQSETLSLNIEIVETGEAPLEPIMISDFGVVGEQINNWGATADLPLYTRESGVLFASVDIPPNTPFNIRENSDWVTSYAPDGASALQLNAFGVSFTVTETGPHLLYFDLNNLTYEITKKDSWGLVGENINNWGATPDIRFTEDIDQQGLWVALNVYVPAGAANLRLNNEWNTTLGPVGNYLEYNVFGAAFNLEEGNYNIVLDIRDEDAITAEFEKL